MSARLTLLAADQTDAELVALCRTGDRAAFAQIVTRYQSLICALAYSGIGNLAASEDLAQETFVTAWRYLADLREPAKLRAWLCEIVRRRAHHLRRQEAGEPTHAADTVESVHAIAAPEPSPAAFAIQRDEETILWREMEQIPELYREPLILFYRQNQSIENVAAALDLSEDAVKQRLSRGRKLLQEQVLAFVEGTLARTNPGPAFTAQVMSALPIAAGSTIKTATIVAAAAAKGATAAKVTGMLGWLGMLMWPVIAILASLNTIIEDNLEDTRPKGREKAWVEKTGFGKLLLVAISIFTFAGILFLLVWGLFQNWDSFGMFMFVALSFVVAGVAVLTAWKSPRPWKTKTFFATGAKQTAAIAVSTVILTVIRYSQVSTLILLGLTLLGLIVAKLARLGNPRRWKFIARTAGWVAFMQVFRTSLNLPYQNHSAFFIGTLVVIGFGFMIMYLVISPETPPPPDATG